MDGIDVLYLILPYILSALVGIWIGAGFGYYTALKDQEVREMKRKEREYLEENAN